jgi:hypothetical protein
MEASIVLAILAVIALIIWSIFAINRHSLDRYDYRPFNIATGFVAFAVLCLAIAALIVASGKNGDWSMTSNVRVLLAASVVLWLAMFVNITRRTSLPIGIYASTMLVPTSVFVVALCVLLFRVMLGNRDS